MELNAYMIEAHIYRKKKGKIEFLLLKRGKEEIYPNLWQMVTGKIKKNEKAYETVLREVKEETNLSVEKLFVVPNVNSFYSFTDDSINFIPAFLCLVNEDDKVKISKEHCEFRWVSKEKAKKMLAWPGQKKSLNIIYSFLIQRNKQIHFVEIK
ncbi:MAG: NUDIX domain-containing protein [Ignavibacteriaceae bacterium]|jgi:dATP pyrophosphohydrolase|nr:NUDIX domain-containing protein [Ignavibacteriaceae bacterium]